MNKVKLAREIAKRSIPRFVEIEPEPRVRTGTAYQALIARDPSVDVRRNAALAVKAEQERQASRRVK